MPSADDFLSSDQPTVFGNEEDSGPVSAALPGGGEGSEAPSKVGRYLLLEQIGKGGMGTVHSAFDPELERTVAVKLMYATRTQERLRREAQAIARVSHPNVISVYDVGYFEHGGALGVFMVMELLHGLELDAWLAHETRTFRERVAVFAQAGRGLAAAHAEGIVHRDFKPTNVIVGADGRALVLDFGLARGLDASADADADADAPEELGDSSDSSSDAELDADSKSSSGSRSMSSAARPGSSSSFGTLGGSAAGLTRSSLLTTELTHHGTIMGTPRFMSPEQHTTHAVDAHSDQYSFCLALYLALVGSYPFAEHERRGVRALQLAKRKGVQAWGKLELPEHIEAALRRGLDPDPALRWPSMEALVEAIEHDPSVRRRRRLLSAGVALGIAATVVGGLGWDLSVMEACEDQRAWIDEVWGGARQAEVEAAFGGVERGYAVSALAHSRAHLDTYAGALAEAEAALCVAEHRSTLEPALIAARRVCLGERHRQLGAVVERFAAADAAIVEHTVDVLSALPHVQPCTELDSTDNYDGYDTRAGDPDARVEIEDALFALRLLAAEGKQAEALERYEPVLERARGLDDPLTLTLVLTRGADLYGSARQPKPAEALANEAALAAERLGAHGLAIDAFASLAKTLSDQRGRWDDAQRTLDIAQAKYARAPGGSHGEWYFHYIQASIHAQHRRLDEMLGAQRRALASLPPDASPMQRAKVLQALAVAELLNDENDAGREHVQRSVELRMEIYGEDHPNLMYPYRTLAKLTAADGDYEGAIERLGAAIELGERHLGPDAPGIIEPHTERATYLRRVGRYADADADYAAAARLRELNGDSPGDALRMRSQVSLRLGDPARALEFADAALAVEREITGSDESFPWLRARFVMHHGEALLALGRYDEALIDFLRSVELRSAKQRDALLVRVWIGEGEARLGLAQLDEARAAFERAAAHRAAGNESDKGVDGRLEWGLAKVATQPRERELRAAAAIAAFVEHGGNDDLAEQVRAWLAALE